MSGASIDPWKNVGRNDPCPCGSGQKYKKCHEGQPIPRPRQPFTVERLQRFGRDEVAPWPLHGGPGISETECSLDPTGEFFFSVGTVLDEVCVQKVSVREQRVVAATTFRLPQAAELPRVLLEGERLSITTDDSVFQFDAKDLTPIEQRVLPQKVPASFEHAEGSFLMPGGRYVWSFGDVGEPNGQVLVTDLERGTIKHVRSGALTPHVLPGPDKPRVLLADDLMGTEVREVNGKSVMAFPDEVIAASPTPDGSGFIAVAMEGEEETEAFAVVHLSEYGRELAVLARFEDALFDGPVAMGTALREGVVAVLISLEDGAWLVGFGLEGGAAKELWRVRQPQELFFVQDAGFQHLVAVSRYAGALRCLPITREAPPEVPRVPRVPHRQSHASCGVWGENAYWFAHDCEEALEEVGIDDLLQDLGELGEYLQLLARLREDGHEPAARAVEVAIKKEWGDIPALGLQRAGDLLRAGRFEEALSELGSAPTYGLSEAEQAHWHHLRLLVLFELGRFDEAARELEPIESNDARECATLGWKQWLAAWRGEAGPLTEWLTSVRAGDAALMADRFDEALAHYDHPLTWERGDVQLAARLAVAVSRAKDVSRLRKRELLHLAQSARATDSMVAWGPMTWSREKLDAAWTALGAELKKP